MSERVAETLAQVLERERMALAVWVAYETETSQVCAEMLTELRNRCDDLSEFAGVLLSIPTMILKTHDALEEGVDTARFLAQAMALEETKSHDKVWDNDKGEYR